MKFIVLGEPKAWMRPVTNMRHGCRWVNDPNKPYKEKAQRQLIDQISGISYIQLDEPFHVELTFFSSIPKSCSTAQKNAKLWHLWEVCHPINKSDCDNFCKNALDYCNGLLYSDDHLVVSLKALKKYSENPRTEIIIKPMVRHMTKEIYETLTLFTPDELRVLAHDIWCLSHDMEIAKDFIETEDGLERHAAPMCYGLEKFAIKHADTFKKIQKKHEKRYSNGKIIC